MKDLERKRKISLGNNQNDTDTRWPEGLTVLKQIDFYLDKTNQFDF